MLARFLVLAALLAGSPVTGCQVPPQFNARAFTRHRLTSTYQGALAHYAKALIAERDGDVALAIREYREAIARDPQ